MMRVFGLLAALFVLGDMSTSVAVPFEVTSSASGTVGADEAVVSRLAEARTLLSGETVALQKGVVGTRRIRVSRRRYRDVAIIGITGREIALAVLDAAGKFHVVRGVKRDNRGFETVSPGYALSLRRENGINSEFECLAPLGGRVLAIKYPVSNERGRFGAGPEVMEVIYTPYSMEIESPEVVRRGLEVQDAFIKKAYDRLKDRSVQSRAFVGRKLAEVIPREVLRVLLINEHIDPGEFKAAGFAAPLSKRVLTVIATNREKAYAYSISSAGARGLVQMIPSTYRLLVQKYPEAGLTPDFSTGMGDPVNAMMAQALLCDSDWQAIRSRVDIGADRIGPYLAAAYNGGVGRVLSLLASEQEEWMENPDLARRPAVSVRERVAVRVKSKKGKRMRTRYVTRTYTVPVFRSQTSKYVGQYHWIKAYLDSLDERAK